MSRSIFRYSELLSYLWNCGCTLRDVVLNLLSILSSRPSTWSRGILKCFFSSAVLNRDKRLGGGPLLWERFFMICSTFCSYSRPLCDILSLNSIFDFSRFCLRSIFISCALYLDERMPWRSLKSFLVSISLSMNFYNFFLMPSFASFLESFFFNFDDFLRAFVFTSASSPSVRWEDALLSGSVLTTSDF